MLCVTSADRTLDQRRQRLASRFSVKGGSLSDPSEAELLEVDP